jgi:hypothetical protein
LCECGDLEGGRRRGDGHPVADVFPLVSSCNSVSASHGLIS